MPATPFAKIGLSIRAEHRQNQGQHAFAAALPATQQFNPFEDMLTLFVWKGIDIG